MLMPLQLFRLAYVILNVRVIKFINRDIINTIKSLHLFCNKTILADIFHIVIRYQIVLNVHLR